MFVTDFKLKMQHIFAKNKLSDCVAINFNDPPVVIALDTSSPSFKWLNGMIQQLNFSDLDFGYVRNPEISGNVSALEL